MQIVVRLLFVSALLFVPSCADDVSGCPSQGADGAPIVQPDHRGWKDNGCTECHTAGNDEGAPIPHDDYRVPECASCHGANGACARPDVTWHPAESCATYNCHGANHGFTDNGDCGACHFAAVGVFQCAVYH